MNETVTHLVGEFERGALTRRELIGRLSALVAAAHVASPVAAQQAGLQATGIDHTSVLVADIGRSAEFYGRVFGLKTVSEDKPNRIVRLGVGSGIDSTIVSIRQQPPAGAIDHFALSVDGFNRERVMGVLKTHGLTPAENLEFGFHVKDPDGAVVQIV